AERLADLDRGHADRAGRAVDKQRLAGLELRAAGQRAVRCVIGGDDRRPDAEIHFFRDAKAGHLGDMAKARRTAVVDAAHHMITDGNARHALANRFDNTGAFGRGDVGEGRLALVFPGDIERGGEAHPRGLVADNDMSGRGLWLWEGLKTGHIMMMAEFTNDDCTHVTLILTCSCCRAKSSPTIGNREPITSQDGEISGGRAARGRYPAWRC